MADWKLRLYHQLPHPLRNVAASLRGYQLRRWRYGPETEKLIEEALERDTWSAAQWKMYQENRLAYVLHRAATRVPYYREQWAERRRRGDQASWEYLENWPILDKDDVRQNPCSFIADDCNIQHMFHEHTSGTTGKPLDLWWSKRVTQEWYALFEARWRNWHGVSRVDRWAIMGGQLIIPAAQTQPPFWVWNQSMRQLYLSSYHLAPQNLEEYLAALNKYKVKYIYAYTSSVYALAQEILRADNRQIPNLQVIFTNAEPLFEHQRETISQAFQCPVRETYGMSEIVVAAGECDHGQLHLWPDVGYIEIAEQEQQVLPGESGSLVCTGLLNTDMPLIRYRLGDRAWMPQHKTSCDCGRTLPILGGIEGRQDDTLYTTDGRRIGRLDPVFKSSMPVREAQIIQETLEHVRVLLVPDASYTSKDGQLIIHRLKERMGTIEVTLQTVTSIPRTPNGKFRAVVCNLSPEERARLS